MIDGSRVVITICQALQDAVVASGAGDRAILIENVMGGDVDAAASVPVREQWSISASTPLVLYTGTFEPYQGLDLLYGAAARLKATHPEAKVLIVHWRRKCNTVRPHSSLGYRSPAMEVMQPSMDCFATLNKLLMESTKTVN